MTFGGVVELFKTLEISSHLSRNIRAHERDEDSKCKQIARIVGNIFNLIGHFCIAIGMITMGATLFTVGPAGGFLMGLNEGLTASLPYLIGSVSCLGTGLIIQQIAR
jgi:hypothetical protein